MCLVPVWAKATQRFRVSDWKETDKGEKSGHVVGHVTTGREGRTQNLNSRPNLVPASLWEHLQGVQRSLHFFIYYVTGVDQAVPRLPSSSEPSQILNQEAPSISSIRSTSGFSTSLTAPWWLTNVYEKSGADYKLLSVKWQIYSFCDLEPFS